MDVVIDGEKGGVVVPEGTSYRVVFELIRKASSSRNRVVLSLVLDGATLTPEQQGSMGDQIAPAEGLMEVTTQEPRTLAMDTLQGLIELVPSIEKLHERGGEQVVAASYQDAMKAFEEGFLGWQAVTFPVAYIANLVSLDLKKIRVGEESVYDRIEKVSAALEKFKTAFTQKDVVRIGDIVQYELRPLLGDWREALEVLRKHLAGGQGTAR